MADSGDPNRKNAGDMAPSDVIHLAQFEKQIRLKKAANFKESCWPCRLTTGFGLIAAGGYVLHARESIRTPIGRGIQFVTATGLISLGFARLFDIPPFGLNEPEPEKYPPSPSRSPEIQEDKDGKCPTR